ncbi:MAG: RNA polymerase sigma factor [Bacteroidaceae bacterium]|nr:RNA polymerase sigma factor [Bacteroidaceae bacterium]
MSKYDEDEIIRLLHDEATKRKAFAEVVNHYSRTLYWQIRHIVVNHDDADDVLQNTFLKAWKSIDGFEGNAQLSTWLYRIAYNESITLLNQKKETFSIDEGGDDDEEGGGTPMQIESDEYIDGDRTQMMLQEALTMLPAKQKAVFTMKYFNDMKYEEIAEVTGTSVGALKASYHIAVEKITKYIKERTI